MLVANNTKYLILTSSTPDTGIGFRTRSTTLCTGTRSIGGSSTLGTEARFINVSNNFRTGTGFITGNSTPCTGIGFITWSSTLDTGARFIVRSKNFSNHILQKHIQLIKLNKTTLKKGK